MTKFELDLYVHYGRIRRVEVERETDSFVWIGGRSYSKSTKYGSYHDTWQEAQDARLQSLRGKLRQTQLKVADLNTTLKAFEEDLKAFEEETEESVE